MFLSFSAPAIGDTWEHLQLNSFSHTLYLQVHTHAHTNTHADTGVCNFKVLMGLGPQRQKHTQKTAQFCKRDSSCLASHRRVLRMQDLSVFVFLPVLRFTKAKQPVLDFLARSGLPANDRGCLMQMADWCGTHESQLARWPPTSPDG